ncbi:MAG: hypothetical protein RR844_01250 [Clostridium sp.]
MKKNKIILLVFIVLMAGIFITRYIYINNKYPKPIVEEYNLNEPVEYNGFEITAKDFQILQDEDLRKLNLDKGILYEDEEMKAMFVTLKIKNVSAETKKIETAPFRIATINWSNGLSALLFQAINEDISRTYLELKPGEEVTSVYPYTMLKIHFDKKGWEQINNEKFSLVLNLYPVKKSIKLN